MLNAAIFVPPDLPLDSYYASSCQAYAIRRGYPEPTVVRSWDTVHALLLTGMIQVVIVALREHCVGATDIQPEVVEDESLATVVILAHRRTSRTGRHRASWRRSRGRPVPASADQLLDDAARRWRFGLPRRRPESISRFPRIG